MNRVAIEDREPRRGSAADRASRGNAAPRPISGSFTHLLEGIGREELKITEVKITPITYKPTDGSYVHECGPVVLTKCDSAVVEIFTDQGLIGIGAGTPADAEVDYGLLIGKNPFDVELLGLAPGLDVACWDLIGQAKSLPVYKLLATDSDPDPRVHVYASGGVMWTYYDPGDGRSSGAEALIEEALQYKELGFDTFKWRPGTDWEEAGITPDGLGEICRKLREAVGPDFDLGLEKLRLDLVLEDDASVFQELLHVGGQLPGLGMDDLVLLFDADGQAWQGHGSWSLTGRPC